MNHGVSAYRNSLCHCIECTEANRLRAWDERASRYARTAANGGVAPAAVHNSSTYSNWGCRCPDCTEAWRVRMARQHARRKAATR